MHRVDERGVVAHRTAHVQLRGQAIDRLVLRGSIGNTAARRLESGYAAVELFYSGRRRSLGRASRRNEKAPRIGGAGE
ncbi:hypothetical protein BI347_06200 [Chromobacterium sphagni]|uniref:Uncharacterized protein n=1 Tax=Chromobacterium sphagni TaxID=1903179 RepID=A0A1S1X1C3_9NEIS|nr:hypothetical protein BI347_06200 [Chromobacterium sphagni]OHX21064.1 hypothetical protein BI344_00485 [Chromobacterium sphagni]